MLPLYEVLKKANDVKNIEQINIALKRFYDTWQRNERVVGDLRFWHYGIIESAMRFYRMASLSEYFAAMDLQLTTIHNALNEFIDGKFITRQEKVDTTSEFEKGLKFLRGARAKFESNESCVKADIMKFMIDCPIFEGDVSTRDSNLYNDTESMLPQIATKGRIQPYLINSYLDGDEIGILLSIIIAFVLSFLFPLSSAGRNREILEGGAGNRSCFGDDFCHILATQQIKHKSLVKLY